MLLVLHMLPKEHRPTKAQTLQDHWSCLLVFGTKRQYQVKFVGVAYPTLYTHLDRDLGNLETKATLWTLYNIPACFFREHHWGSCGIMVRESNLSQRLQVWFPVAAGIVGLEASNKQHSLPHSAPMVPWHSSKLVYLICDMWKYPSVHAVHCFPAEHCPKHHTPSDSLSSSHSASWCQHSPR